MKKLIIILLLLTSCSKTKQAIESVQIVTASDSLPIMQTCEIESKTRQEIRLEKITIKEQGKTDRRKSKDARKNHKQDVKLAIVDSKQETKRFKSENNTTIDSLKQENKGAKIQKQIIKQENKIESKKETFWIVFLIVFAIVVLIAFFIFLYLRKR